MANDFPMTRQQYDEKLSLLQDPEALGAMSLGELKSLRQELVRFQEAQQDTVKRLRAQGLNSQQVDQVLGAQGASAVDPNDPSMEGRVLQEPDRDIAGAVEGFKQSFEGVADLAFDVSVGIGKLLPAEIAAKADMDPAAREQWKSGVAEARTKRRVKQMQQFGQLPGELAEIVGQAAPWMWAKNTASGFISLMARNGFLGGAAAASQFQPSGDELSDRAEEALFGMGLGTLIGGGLGVPGLMRKTASKGLVKAFNEADPKQREIVEKMVQDMTGDKDFVFSAAELTGTRFYLGLEQAAGDTAQLKARASRLDTLYNHIQKRLKDLSRNPTTPGKIAAELGGTLKVARDDLYQQASSSWSSGINAILKSYGDDVVIDGTSFLGKLDEMVAQEVSPLINVGAKPSAALLDYRNFVAKKVAQQGGLKPKDVDEITQGLNRLIGGQVKVFENASPGTDTNIGRALMGALTADLTANARNPAAANALQLLRKGYRQDMAAAEAIENTVFNQIFGQGKIPTNPGQAVDELLKMEPGDQRHFAKFLQEAKPDLYYDMQRAYLKRVTLNSQAGPKDPDVAGNVSMTKLADNLADSFGRQGKVGSGFFNPALQKELKTTADAIRILANKTTKADIGGTRPEEWTINLISRSPEFFGRFVTRLLASGETLETALLNPSWREAMRTIATQPLGTDKMKFATVFLAQWMGEREQLRAFEQKQQAQMDQSKAFAAESLQRGDRVQ